VDIGFIVPKDVHSDKPFKNTPLIHLYLLTILEKHFGGEADLELIDLRGVNEDDIEYYLPEKDAYFYTATSPEYDRVLRVLGSLRKIYPSAKHVAGGTHVQLFPDECVKDFDAIALGEGEDLICDVVRDLQQGRLQKIYRNSTTIDLNAYPYPSRKYLPKKAVVDTDIIRGYQDLPGTSVNFSRGCPFKCTFCANMSFGPTRFRAPHLVEEEIEYLKKEYGVQALAFKDDNVIPFKKSFAKEYLEAIGRTGIKFRGQTRANGVPEEMVALAAQAGCTDIGIGVESIFPETLKIIKKGIDIDKAKDYIKVLNKNGIGPRVHLILGLPAEPDNVIEECLKFIDETEPASVLLSLFCPMPGTPMADNPDAFGMKILDHDWEDIQVTFGRFHDEEAPGTVFEYKEVTPWGGKGKSRERILSEYNEFQAILRERGLNF